MLRSFLLLHLPAQQYAGHQNLARMGDQKADQTNAISMIGQVPISPYGLPLLGFQHLAITPFFESQAVLLIYSVTRLLICVFNLGHLQQLNFAQL